jgi:hypothetical protein
VTLPAIFALACLFAPAAQADSHLFYYSGYTSGVCGIDRYCRESGMFGALVGLGSAVSQRATVTGTGMDINGELGVGSGSTITYSGGANVTWDGPIDFADALTGVPTGPPCTGTAGCKVPTGNSLTSSSPTRNVTVAGGVFQNATLVNDAIAQVNAMSTYWWGQLGTQKTNVGVSGGTTSLGVVNGGVQVFWTDRLNTNTTLTINGNGGTDMVILNITGSSTAGVLGSTTSTIANSIVLNGIHTDQVLFNFLGTNGASKIMTLNTGVTVGGTFLVAADDYTARGNLNGRLFGGKGAVSWSSLVLDSPPAAVPEPSTWLLMGTGVAGLIYAAKRRKK